MFVKGETKQDVAELSVAALHAALAEISAEGAEVLYGVTIDGIAASGLHVRKGPNGDWLLTVKWGCSEDHPLAARVNGVVVPALVSFHGGSSILGSVARLLEDCAEGKVRLYPDRFAVSEAARGAAGRGGNTRRKGG